MFEGTLHACRFREQLIFPKKSKMAASELFRLLTYKSKRSCLNRVQKRTNYLPNDLQEYKLNLNEIAFALFDGAVEKMYFYLLLCILIASIFCDEGKGWDDRIMVKWDTRSGHLNTYSVT